MTTQKSNPSVNPNPPAHHSHLSQAEPLPLTTTAARDQCLLGDWYFNERHYTLAIQSYKRALELDPECAAIHHRLGLAYYKEGEFDSARDSFKKAISLNPSNAHYHYSLGQLLQDYRDLDGTWQEAIREFSRAIELDPSYVEAWYDRGSLHDKRGELARACHDFQQVVARMPNYAARYNLAVLYIKRQMWAEAQGALEEILSIEPNDSDAYYHLADVHLKSSGDLNLAIDCLKHAIERDPDHLDARFALGLLYAKNRYKQPEYRQDAITQFVELVSSNEKLNTFDQMDQVYFILGSLYDDVPADAEMAISAYQTGLEHVSSAQVRNNLGLLYLQKKQIQKAAEEFRQAIRLEPEYEAPYHNLAKLYFYEHDEELLKDLRGWLTFNPQEAAAIIFRLSLSLIDVARAEGHQSLFSRLHRVKNLVSVGGAQLRSALRQSDPASKLHGKLHRTLTQHEDSFNQLTEILETLRTDAPVSELVDINRLIENLLIKLRSVSTGKRIECKQQLASNLPFIKGDSSQLKEAFHNVLINAFEAMEDGGVLQIHTEYQPQSLQVQISVADSGKGIPDSLRHKIFQPGYTLKEGGSGFGLTIVQRTVRDHMGSIDLRSAEGGGTTFIIYLPVNPDAVPIKTNLQMRPIFYEARGDLAFEELV
ncbi:MAG: tetratricopeptide repeat protein [Candidatus Poribacteria bacterium]|nr:tetratricopeptide repeat protein [Candidatus Poribacteria bacterium]MDE0506906.1 tetratricopeptide repeat protein [Candidatus Poribacteria bacterium]